MHEAESLNNLVEAPSYPVVGSHAIADDLVRIGRAEIDYALALLQSIPEQQGYAVHQCRKTIKRLRALVRLGQDWHEVDRLLRDAARHLSGLRDAEVMRRTVEHLIGRIEDAGTIEAVDSPRLEKEVVERVAAALKEARACLTDCLAADRTDLASVTGGLKRSFKKASRAMHRFEHGERTADAHRWRKGVQRLSNQWRLLEPVVPDETSATLETLHQLAEHLGEFNDLTILHSAIDDKQFSGDKSSLKAVRKAIKRRQRELRAITLDLGSKVFERNKPALVA